MNKKIKWIVAGLGLVQLSLYGLGAKAQEAKKLNEVVVFATKSDLKQSQTGKVIAVIDSVELSRNAGRTLAELLNQQAGINVVGSGSNLGKDKSLFFRGAASAYAVILLDGMLITDPSGTGGAFDLRLINIDQIERIEILKGGQSTLYGSEAVAGVFNIITKKATSEKIRTNVVLSGGSYDTFKGAMGLGGSQNKIDYQFNYNYLKTAGISEAENPIGSVQQFDRDGMSQQGVDLRLTYRATGQLSLSPFFRYFRGNFKYDDGPFKDALNTSASTHYNGGIQAIYKNTKGKLSINYSRQQTERNYQSTYGGEYIGKIDLVDVFYNRKLNNQINILVGAENRNMAVRYENSSPSTNVLSAYTSVFVQELGIFNFELGGRINHHNKYGNNATYSFTPTALLNPNVKLFGTISSAFRAPTLDMLFGQYGANLELKPEKSTSYETGADLNAFANKFKLRIVAFKRNVNDAIIYGANGYINQDEQKDRGFELEPALQFGKTNVGAYLAFVEGTSYQNGKQIDFLLRRPKHTIGANVGHQIAESLFLRVNYKFTGERVDSDFATYPEVNKNLPAYHLVDFYAQYELLKKRVKLFGDFKNLLNEKYTEIIGYRTMGTNFNLGLSLNLN